MIAPQHVRGRRQALNVFVLSTADTITLILIGWAVFTIVFSPSRRLK